MSKQHIVNKMPRSGSFAFHFFFFVCCCFIIGATHSQQISADLNDTIKDVFQVDDNGECICVQYYQCSNGSILEDGFGIIKPRFGELPKCECQCEELKECCRKPPLATTRIVPPNPTTNLPIRLDKNPVIKKETKCGKYNPDGVGFRQQASPTKEDTKFGEFPWMIAVFSKAEDEDEFKYECGGSLIHTKVVLTAAHCVTTARKTYKVRAGEWDTQATDENLPHQDRFVAEIEAHEDFNSGNLRNDIALVLLEKEVKLAENVGIICLPPRDIKIPNGAKCWASGWGKDVFVEGYQPEAVLKKVELPTVAPEECQKRLRKTRVGPFYVLHPSFMCAGGVYGKDTCQGDGGGPLVCPMSGAKNRYYQAGIVSWGIDCGSEIPAVYASVTNLRDWIDAKMAKFHLNTLDHGLHENIIQ